MILPGLTGHRSSSTSSTSIGSYSALTRQPRPRALRPLRHAGAEAPSGVPTSLWARGRFVYGRRIELHRNAVQVGTKVVVGTLKSNENRTVVLPKFVIDALAETAKGKGRDDLFWSTRSGGYMGPPASKESWLSGAVSRCQKADPTFPRATAHALRHTAASLAISAGANPKVFQRMLGHASAAMTLDVYADLFDSDLTSVAESVGKMWARQSQPHERSMRKRALPGNIREKGLSPLSGLN